jgi:hypothetical protein
VTLACNPSSTQEAGIQDYEFHASLGHMARLCQKQMNKTTNQANNKELMEGLKQ